MSARTRVHSCHEHEVGRIIHGEFVPCHSYMSILQRLTQYFERRTLKLSELVEKEHAIVGEADFSGLRVVAASD